MQSLIQIVPYFAPQVTGVGDYALILAKEFRRAHGLETQFIVANPSWSGPQVTDGFTVKHLRSRSAVDLACLLRADAASKPILLHYSGYGFHTRGFPFWLARGLRDARITGPLATMFHELFAFGPPWTSAFWTSFFQRAAAANLARVSDCSFTNRHNSAEWIEAVAPRHKGSVSVFPVFSNFGEPSTVPPLSERPPHGLVWGSMGRCIHSPEEAVRRISICSRHLGLERLTVVGKPAPGLESPSLHVDVVYNPSASQLSQMLLQSRVGFLDYFDGYLGKSSIFAAYASHGVVPVLLEKNHSDADGLRACRDYLETYDIVGPVALDLQQRVSLAARAWYEPHNATRTAAAIAARIAVSPCRNTPKPMQALEIA